MKFTLAQVREAQDLGIGSGMDPFEDEDLASVYELKTIWLDTIDTAYYELSQPFTVAAWTEYDAQFTVMGKPCDSTEDKRITVELMLRYITNQEMSPIVLDSRMRIIDGLHRYVAALTLGMTTIQAFVPVQTNRETNK